MLCLNEGQPRESTAGIWMFVCAMLAVAGNIHSIEDIVIKMKRQVK